jgi:hypothetical protein
MRAALASTDRRSKNVAVKEIIVPELKFRNVQRHVLARDPVQVLLVAALRAHPQSTQVVTAIIVSGWCDAEKLMTLPSELRATRCGHCSRNEAL